VPVLALFGPTASGKSAIAVALAEAIGGEIVSCDAMQLYRGLPILTNQPPAGDRARVPHHLIGVWPLDHAGAVPEYAALAHAAIDDVLARGRVPIVCGGSGLYLRAALAELGVPPRPRPGERERLERAYDRLGAARAHAALARRDPAAAAGVHPRDRRRVVRALELHRRGASLHPRHDRLWSPSARHPTTVVGLAVEPAVLRARIAARTRAMFAAGVAAEVAAALAAGALSHTAAAIHGVSDVAALLRGEIGEEEAIRRLTVTTCRYAKRQRTWMRRIPGLVTFEATAADPATVAARIAALRP
jgi:tRNA dimethylallyltransferase